jgi:hypothetical protein
MEHLVCHVFERPSTTECFDLEDRKELFFLVRVVVCFFEGKKRKIQFFQKKQMGIAKKEGNEAQTNETLSPSVFFGMTRSTNFLGWENQKFSFFFFGLFATRYIFNNHSQFSRSRLTPSPPPPFQTNNLQCMTREKHSQTRSHLSEC